MFHLMIVSCGWFIALCAGLIVSIWVLFKIGCAGIHIYGVTNEPDVIIGFLILMALVLAIAPTGARAWTNINALIAEMVRSHL